MVNKNFKKIVATFVIGGILIGVGTTVNANAQTSGSSTLTKITQAFRGHGHKNMTWENISKETKTKLDPLVKAGTITQSQEDKIISSIKTKFDEKTAQMNKVNSMTDAQKKAYFESQTKDKPDILKDLVSSNIITQAQADAVQKVIGMGARGDMKPQDRTTDMKTSLDSAVKAGTITQVQEDKILVYFAKVETDRKAEMDKVKAMSEADRNAYFQSKTNTARPDPLADIVKAGTITQAQADKLKSTIPMHADRDGQGGKHGRGIGIGMQGKTNGIGSTTDNSQSRNQ